MDEFGWMFADTPERWHFAEYLTGLMVAERKNVSAINAEFAQTTDPSCLNLWITQVPWDVEQLNEHRLAWLQSPSSTRYSAREAIANYVCSQGKHYPLEFRRFRKRGRSTEGASAPQFKNHKHLFKELVD